jgi:hypothetical protein
MGVFFRYRNATCRLLGKRPSFPITVKSLASKIPQLNPSPWSSFILACLLAAVPSLSRAGDKHDGASALKSLSSIRVRNLSGEEVRPFVSEGAKANVFFFIMHECPVANGYAPEISRIATEYAGRGIRSHIVYFEDDLEPAAARTHAREYGYKSGVVLDPEHLLVKAAGATVSPEAAVFSPSGELLYRGRIDDRVADFGKRRVEPTRRDLRLALDAILAGRPVPTRLTRAVGCYIPENHKPARTSNSP